MVSGLSYTRMDQTPDHIWLLIARKLSGEADASELRELEQLLREHPDAGYFKELLHDFWQNQPVTDPQYAENRYKDLVQQMKTLGIDEGKFTEDDHYINPETEVLLQKGNRKNKLLLLGAAALLLIAGITAWQWNRSMSAVAAPEVASLNQINTRNGSKTSLVLPDGTKVWLNSGSQLRYDKHYGNKQREVSLTGEAYFDVVKNPDLPFVIHTNRMDIKVLGTAFNVKCYPGEKTTETSLIRGSIEVTLKDRQEKIRLKPNEKLVVSDAVAAEELSVKQAESSPGKEKKPRKPLISLSSLTLLPADNTIIETAWVMNRLVFSSETFEEVALKMERWYNVKISFSDESLKSATLTGNFEKETLGEALSALQLVTPFSYSIKNDLIVINRPNR